MSTYISSIANRLYIAKETIYGQVPAITAAARTPFVKFRATQRTTIPRRRDKTGSRSFAGVAGSLKRETQFSVSTHLFGGMNPADTGLATLIEGAMGGSVRSFTGGTISASPDPSVLQFASAPQLEVGQAVVVGDEMRFVGAVLDSTTVQVSAPFSSAVAGGSSAGATITFKPGSQIPSLTVFDYWSPSSAVHRVVRGAAVNDLKISINGDFHALEASGVAADLVDSASFETGQGGLVQFPTEPAVAVMAYEPVPGHLGQVWIGATPERFCTLTEGTVRLVNNVESRDDEFGSALPQAVVPGPREVEVSFSLYEKDDIRTAALYQAARQRSPIPMTWQLGQVSSHICGIYVPGFVPAVPGFGDDNNRLTWQFDASKAQGAVDDEFYIAFG